MKISIIISCLNEEDTIANQLTAVTSQRWSEPWETIVSDNGSTDGSLNIITQFSDKFSNLSIVDASDRKGSAHALNVGVKAAIGESLLFCDSDDEVSPGWLAAMGKALSKHSFVACRTDINRLNPLWVRKSRLNPQGAGIQKFDYPPYLPHAGGGTIGVKRQLHEAIGGFDESLTLLHDTDYCWRIQLRGIKLHFVPDAVVNIRFRDNFKDICRQANGYGEYVVLLIKRYQKFRMTTYLRRKCVSPWPYQIKALLQIRDKGDLAKLIWQLYYIIGRMKGSIKYRIFAF